MNYSKEGKSEFNFYLISGLIMLGFSIYFIVILALNWPAYFYIDDIIFVMLRFSCAAITLYAAGLSIYSMGCIEAAEKLANNKDEDNSTKDNNIIPFMYLRASLFSSFSLLYT